MTIPSCALHRIISLLGTAIELRIVGPPSVAHVAEVTAVAEIQRCEHVFSAFVETSELNRWRNGRTDSVSDEFSSMLRTALQWQAAGHDAFDPDVGELARMWARGGDNEAVPDRADLRAAVARIGSPAYVFEGSRLRRLRDCSDVNFNAIAKGYIVDREASAGMAVAGVESIVVNSGGDVVHRATSSVAIGIENPATPYDNVPPMAIVDVADRSVATSGSARRGLDIGGRRYSHVIVPRTGWPVDDIRSASVIAIDACTADAVATIVGVMDVNDGRMFVDSRGRQLLLGRRWWRGVAERRLVPVRAASLRASSIQPVA